MNHLHSLAMKGCFPRFSRCLVIFCCGKQSLECLMMFVAQFLGCRARQKIAISSSGVPACWILNSTIVKQKYRLGWTTMGWYIDSVIQTKTAEVIFTNLTFSGCFFWNSGGVLTLSYMLYDVCKEKGWKVPSNDPLFLSEKSWLENPKQNVQWTNTLFICCRQNFPDG